MNVNARIKKIEMELQDTICIPNSEKLVVFWPEDTAEEKEMKVKGLQEKLALKYGEDVAAREELFILSVVYDDIPIDKEE